MSASTTERAAQYHADDGPNITLSSSLAAKLVLQTPAHAWAAHPKLNPDYQSTYTDATDLGTAVHQLLLRDDRIVVGEYPDWRTKTAREFRDSVRDLGKVPMLEKDWDKAQKITQHVRDKIVGLNVDPVPFTEGTPEYTLRFQTGGAKCRAMLDWWRDDQVWIDDLKTTRDASPRKVARHIFNYGYDIRAAFYIRAIEAEHQVTPGFRWVFIETAAPYPVTIATLTAEAMAKAHAKVDGAIHIWNECLRTGEWPAYPVDMLEVDLPPWEKDLWAEVDTDESVPF